MTTLTATMALLALLPPVVGEKATVIDRFTGDFSRWTCPADVKLARAGQPGPVDPRRLDVSYRFAAGQKNIVLDYRLPAAHPVAERLRFRLKGDGSRNKMQVWCRYKNEWRPLAMVSLKPDRWQHIEIPASSPLLLFYRDVTDFRFLIVNREDREYSGTISLGPLEMVNPRLVTAPLKPKKIPSPVFDTWGDAGKDGRDVVDNLKGAAGLGVNLHLTPISFPLETREESIRDWDRVTGRVDAARAAGMMAGISFYNSPTAEFIRKHPQLRLVNENNEPYDTGGYFVSPWHPDSQRIWHDHIVNSLSYLKKRGTLNRIDVVMMCPGLESEVSYEWSHIWAFDDWAIKAYRAYLKRAYANRLAALNRDWSSEYASFDEIRPPGEFYPDREHWVFQEFYRWSMLKWSIQQADAVREVFTPRYWLWLPHTHPDHPGRYYSARYPLFYIENMRRLGVIDYAHIAALDWQTREDVEAIQKLGVRTIGEIDVVPTPDRLKWTFEQCRKYGFDGVYIGVVENIFKEGKPTSAGELCGGLIKEYR